MTPVDYALPEIRVSVTSDLMNALTDALAQDIDHDSRIEFEALLLQLRLVARAQSRSMNGGW